MKKPVIILRSKIDFNTSKVLCIPCVPEEEEEEEEEEEGRKIDS